jgi:hypothetical protein
MLLAIYIAVCFGKIAAKYGKNPILYGLLSVISPLNLIILGYWAFSDKDNPSARQNKR